MRPRRDIRIGERFGHRVILCEVAGTGRRVRFRCDCGVVSETSYFNLSRSPRCKWCCTGEQKPESDPVTELAAVMREARKRCPDVWVGRDDGLCPEDRAHNEAVRVAAVVALVDVVGPMMLAEIGELWGVSREMIRQFEARSLSKIRRRRKMEPWRK